MMIVCLPVGYLCVLQLVCWCVNLSSFAAYSGARPGIHRARRGSPDCLSPDKQSREKLRLRSRALP